MNSESVIAFIRKGHSKKHALEVTRLLLEYPQYLKELVQLLTHPDVLVCQQAAWPLSCILCEQPELGFKHQKQLIKTLRTSNLHPAVYRNIWKAFTCMSISEAYESELLDLGFQCIQDPKMPVAPKVYAMETLFQLILKYPELEQEYVLVMESQTEGASAGYKSRMKKIITRLAGAKKNSAG